MYRIQYYENNDWEISFKFNFRKTFFLLNHYLIIIVYVL